MAIAKRKTVIDGQVIDKGEELPDLGSWVATDIGESGRNIRHYEGLHTDVGKLPHYVSTGSSAFCVDTGDYYKYEKTTDTWYQM